MKKVISITLCLVLAVMALVAGVQPAEAAGSAHMSISSSASTLHRGDTFTLTVYLSNDQPVSNGGVILSYDSSVFEFLGGSCHVSNAALSEVSASRNGGVFVMQSDAVVSGTIFTIQMRVKDGASFGSYSISGSPSLGGVPCSLSGTNVTVECVHAYGPASRVDDSSHALVCTICGQKQTEAHTWDGGTVLKVATCKETGTKLLTCTGCEATKEETIPVSNEHRFSAWNKISDTQHSHTCSVCGKSEKANHTWNGGTVLEAATCQKTGVLRLTCTGCSATKTEVIPVAAHTYDGCVYVDDTCHKSSCTVCAQVLTENHQYSDAWVHDENWHFHRCTGCGHEKDQAAHVPGPKATETTDQVCTVCNRILQPSGNHVHTFGAEWVFDETGHWHTCSDCNEKDSAGTHVFADSCDAACDICGMTRQPEHTPAQEWASDATGHWHICAGCGEKTDFATHIPGPEATIASPQVCTLCGFEVAAVLPHAHVFDSQGTLHSHVCACGDTYEAEAGDCEICKPFPWWIVCVAEAVVFCGILGAMYFRRRKK